MKSKPKSTKRANAKMQALMLETGHYNADGVTIPFTDPQFEFHPQYPRRKKWKLDPRDMVGFYREGIAQIEDVALTALAKAVQLESAERAKNYRAGRGRVSNLKWDESAHIPEDLLLSLS